MAEDKKPGSQYGNWIAIALVGYAIVRYGIPYFMEPAQGTAAETHALMEKGVMATQIALELEDPKMMIEVTTIFGGVEDSMGILSGGITGPQQEFVLREVEKLLIPCRDKTGEEGRACVNAIDFTLPPYRP